MPSGLDGNPNPITSPARSAVLERLAGEIHDRRRESVLRVGVDGIDGAGKTTLADELAVLLRRRDVRVIRSTTDSFHNPRRVRWRRGRWSPDGFYRDSYDLDALKTLLLDRLGAVPPAPFRAAAFDEDSDSVVDAPIEEAAAGDVLLFDGLFLARPELRDYWDYLIYVDGEPRVGNSRISAATADCPPGMMAFWHLARWWVMSERYAGGQRLYVSECRPQSRADARVDNNDLRHPALTLRRR